MAAPMDDSRILAFIVLHACTMIENFRYVVPGMKKSG
jgi:hypothetical protein